MKSRRIYVASSWKNVAYPSVVAALTGAGHRCYDFRNPGPNDKGFDWSDIDPDWQQWTPEKYRQMLNDPLAVAGFDRDKKWLDWADTCVLVLPCGRSAHLEAGYSIGHGKDTFILMLDREQPDLMYKLATAVCLSIAELLTAIADRDSGQT